MKKKLEVGMKLFFVFSRYSTSRSNCEVEVTKVGRKWAELSNNFRISLDKWIADGGHYMSPGSCYESREEYEEELKANSEWSKFRRMIGMRPDTATVEKIKQAIDLLGLKGN